MWQSGRRAVWLVLGLMITAVACSDDDSARTAQPITRNVDAGRDAGADSGDELERRIQSLPLKARDADEEMLWLGATEVEVSFTASSCFGTCPDYKYSADQAGHLHFEGNAYVARPGVYDAELSNARVSSLVYSLIRSGFLRLNASYTQAEDGCVIVTDQPAYSIRLQIPDHTKEIDYYRGCFIKGPAFDALQSIVKELQDWIADRNFTAPNPRECSDQWLLEHALHESYALFDSQQQPVGLLHVGPVPKERYESRTWQLLTCEGKELYAGTTAERRGCETVLLPGDSHTFTWPGIERPVNAVILQRQDTSMQAVDVISLLALDATSEVHLQARAADSCKSQ